MEKLDPKAIGARIRQRRTELGFSQPALAAEMKQAGFDRGFSQQNLVTLEKGATKEVRAKVMDLAPILYTSVEWLLFERGPKVVGTPVLKGAQFDGLPLDFREKVTALWAERHAKKRA